MHYITRMPDSLRASRSKGVSETVCAATALRKASRRLAQLYDQALVPCDLKSTQYAILSQIESLAARAPTMRELADELVMDRSTLGHNLRPLERDGLVETIAGVEDKRVKHIALTKAGQRRLREAKQRWQLAQNQFLSVFGEAAAIRLRNTLSDIAHDERLFSLVD